MRVYSEHRYGDYRPLGFSYTSEELLSSSDMFAVNVPRTLNSAVFLDGPVLLHLPDQPQGFSILDEDGFAIPSQTPLFEAEETPRGWCTFNEDKTRYEGAEDAFRVMKSVLERERFDGVIGFSQGAALGAYLCAFLEDPSTHPLFHPRFHPPFKFAILASSFLPADPPLPKLIRTPTLHIIGKNDTHIGAAESGLLVGACEDPRVEFHEGGHFIPAKATWRRFFHEWILAFSPQTIARPEDVSSPAP
ncbi:hypothetical protein CALVIDRAFT_566079 [Calocera viscosa TUFC12733]|uniref:Serine hydrolase domain-containing protein n=1 Tax=Calocera viscosa (strain TUFC12733) TaxID=1330018 RepID=A0A167JS29_CALVF|nr:hypothetical protein CALVIDRAFT_566079 [Calocera viscosa TUFC12733]